MGSGYGFVNPEKAICFDGANDNITESGLQVRSNTMTMFLDAWVYDSESDPSTHGNILSLQRKGTSDDPQDEIGFENRMDSDSIKGILKTRYYSYARIESLGITPPERFTVAVTISIQDGARIRYNEESWRTWLAACTNSDFDLYERLQLGVRGSWAYANCRIHTLAFFPRILTTAEIDTLRTHSLAGFTGMYATASGAGDRYADLHIA